MAKKKIVIAKKKVVKAIKRSYKKRAPALRVITVSERIESKMAEIAALSADRNAVTAKIKKANDELNALNVEKRGF